MGRPRTRPVSTEPNHAALEEHERWLAAQVADLQQQIRSALLEGESTRNLRHALAAAQREHAEMSAAIGRQTIQDELERTAQREQVLADRASELVADVLSAHTEMLAAVALPPAPALRTDAR